MQNNFIVEFLKRLLTKNPKFFRIIQVVSVIVAIITGLPPFLESVGITLPVAWEAIGSKAVATGAAITAILSQLPNQDVNQPAAK